MITTIDHVKRTLSLQEYPQRIVSLVPSITELLYDLGLREEVTGITKFCIHPDQWFRSKTRIGGTKNLNIEKIRSLKPDLIIANKEENDPLQINELMKEFPVWISDVGNFEEALEMILEISVITNRNQRGIKLVEEIKSKFRALDQLPNENIRCAYLIWKNPIMTVGGDTFISSMLQYCGFKNVYVDKKRYPEITMEELQETAPEFLLLSSEPYPFKDKDKSFFEELLPASKVLIVDGEMFSWYGSHLVKSPDYFQSLRKNEFVH